MKAVRWIIAVLMLLSLALLVSAPAMAEETTAWYATGWRLWTARIRITFPAA